MKDKNQKKSTLDEIAKHINKLPTPTAIQENYSVQRLCELKKHLHKELENSEPTGKKKTRYQECLKHIEAILQTGPASSRAAPEEDLHQISSFSHDSEFTQLKAQQQQDMQAVLSLKTIPELANAFNIEQLILIRDHYQVLREALVRELHRDTRSIQLGAMNRKLSIVNDAISRCNKAVSMNQRKAKKLRNIELREKQQDRTCERSYSFLREFMQITAQHLSDKELKAIKEQVHRILDQPHTRAAA